MTSPPADAFTLAMSHRRAPPRSRSITRSPSPKISFSTPTHHHPHLPPALRQRKSHPEPPQLAQVDEADDVVAPAVVPAPISTTVSTAVKDDKGKKVDWEIPRKTLHSSIGFLTLWLYSTGGSPEPVILALALALCVIVPADVLRLNWPAFARVYETFLGFLMRESEKRKSNGVIWYIVGVLWVLTLYPVDIAVISILLLSWADTAASTFGRLWGRHTPPLPRHLLFLPLAPRKSLAGFLAAFITGASVVAGFYALASPPNASWSFIDGAREAGYDASVVGLAVRAWLRENVDGWSGVGSTGGWVGAGVLAVGAGVVTAIAEALDLGELDDNLTLPIIAGGATWALVRIMSWFA